MKIEYKVYSDFGTTESQIKKILEEYKEIVVHNHYPCKFIGANKLAFTVVNSSVEIMLEISNDKRVKIEVIEDLVKR